MNGNLCTDSTVSLRTAVARTVFSSVVARSLLAGLGIATERTNSADEDRCRNRGLASHGDRRRGQLRGAIAVLSLFVVVTAVLAGGSVVLPAVDDRADTDHEEPTVTGSSPVAGSPLTFETTANTSDVYGVTSDPVNAPSGPPDDKRVVVRFEEDHVVSGSLEEDLPPEPAIAVNRSDGGYEDLIVDEHDDYDLEVVQTPDGDVAKVNGTRPVYRVDDDPDLVVLDDEQEVVVDELQVDRDTGLVRTVDGDEVVAVNGTPIEYPEYNYVDLGIEITDVENADEGESISVDVAINNSRWADASEEVVFRLLDDGNRKSLDEIDGSPTTIDVEGDGETTHTFSYDTESGDYVFEEVKVEVKDTETVDGDSDTAPVEIGAAGAAVFITNSTAAVAGDELSVTADIDRYGNVPEGSQRYPISLFIDGDEVETKVYSLAPGDSTTATFRYETDADDVPETDVEVSSRTDSDSVDIPVVSREEHNRSIEAAITGTNVDQLNLTGELEVDTAFDYDGDIPGGETEFQAHFVVNGDVEDRRNVTLAGSDPTNETFVFARNETHPPIENITIETPGEEASVEFDRRTDVTFTDVTDPAARNETLEATVSVEDIGETPGRDVLTIETTNPVAVDNATRERTIVLEGGESTTETVTFELTEDAPPTLELRASTGDAVETTSVEVRDDVSRFVVEEVILEGADDPDSGLDVTGTIRNAGGVSGAQTVRLTLDGEPIRTEEIVLEPDEEVTLSAGVPTSDEGTYAFGASTDDDEYSDTSVATATETESAPDDEGSSLSLPVSPATLLVVLASIAGAIAVGAGVIKYRDDPATVRARARQLRNTVLGAVPFGDSGTVIVQNDLPRTSLVRVRVRSENDVVFVEDFELAENERRTFDCLPDAERFDVGAGVDDITSHEETFGEGTETVAIVLRPEGITIREL
ncbi:hypothetical protein CHINAEXTREME_06270 [Halobiforma lacisalsi AJ5]|uniref:CARDB domain-containing protein n=2 Tax=Natronobacterium lacisalsi TaxID=229731 RepID=M0LXI7_NATLA|nr:hypothetical protein CHINAEXTREME_06270 [Halobiforma lacisalsi AJ5]EMA38307.1 hypothetical protein C445_00360 [Halobiforma lacisalsi AJ5]